MPIPGNGTGTYSRMTTHWTTPSEAADLVRSKPSKGLRLSLPFVTLVSSGTGGMDQHIDCRIFSCWVPLRPSFLFWYVCVPPTDPVPANPVPVRSCFVSSPALPVKFSLGKAKPAQLLLYTLYTCHTHPLFPLSHHLLLHFSFAFFEGTSLLCFSAFLYRAKSENLHFFPPSYFRLTLFIRRACPMAFPVYGGDEYPPIRPYSVPPFPIKRRTADFDDDNFDDDGSRYKRYRSSQDVYRENVGYKVGSWSQHHFYHQQPVQDGRREDLRFMAATRGTQDQQYRHQVHFHAAPHHHQQQQQHLHQHHGGQHHHQNQQHSRSPESSSCAMERTASGHSIRAEPTPAGPGGGTELLEDDIAAERVREHMANFRRKFPDSKHERILRSIINPRINAEDELDNDSLESIFSAANEIFFNGRLSQRVRWDWSDESSTRYDSRVIGTTALRRADPNTRGFETLIVLSAPILKHSKYSRRLLISTFLHELIHSYLFICRGFRARECGGHTKGFLTIAKLVDDWAGPESALYLSEAEADLERFRIGGQYKDHRSRECGRIEWREHSFYPCSGIMEQRRDHAATQSVDVRSHSTAPPSSDNFHTSSSHEEDYYHSNNTRSNRIINSSTSTTTSNSWWIQPVRSSPFIRFS